MTSSAPDKSALPGFLFRFVGYGLLILSLLNFIDTVLPPNLMSPAWSFQTFGALVESSAIPVLAFVLVFYGKLENRKPLELLFLYGLSWIAMLLAVAYLLLVPLGLTTAIRVSQISAARINYQNMQQLTQLQQLKTRLDSASEPQLRQVLQQVQAQREGQPEAQVAAPEIGSVAELKDQLQKDLAQAEKSSVETTKQQIADKQFELLKRAIKWGVGALVVGVIFIYIWRETKWIRTIFK